MKDKIVVLQDLKDQVSHFVAERNWKQFHSPANLSSAISIEAAELMEKFLWMGDAAARSVLDTNRQEVEDELADVIIACLAFANECSIDVGAAVEKKIKDIEKKYPVEKAKGTYLKYTKL